MSRPIPIVMPEDVTPAWMSEVLARRGVDAQIARIDTESVGTGQLGETCRFRLEYRGSPDPRAPRALVGKFPSANALAAETGKTMGFYRSEVMFYRELAHRTAIRTPAVWLAEIDEGNDFVLIFEDLAPSQAGDQMRGCTLEQARAALSEAALLHSAFWNDAELMRQPWLYVPEGAQGFYTTEMIERSWDHVKKNYADRLAPEVVAVCEKYVRNHAYWNRPRPLPKCFSHNDFRPDNMLFGGPGERVAVVDWQTSNFLGSGMDVAYFLAAIFEPEVRKANERALLRGYYDELIGHGVTGYSFDALLRDYAHYSFAMIAVAVAAFLIVKQTDRGDRLFLHMITGAALQALDNDALDDLPE